MIILENDHLKVSIKPFGAELCSIKSKVSEIEYIWSGDPKFWNKTSPVLFPIVGGLKNNTYFYEGKEYHLNRHGFAREMPFEVEYADAQKVILCLEHSEETLKNYPFQFAFRVIYKLFENTLSVSYNVENLGLKTMYFSVGGHPAFAVPIDINLNYDNYFLQFNKDQELSKYPLNAEGLTLTKSEPITEMKNGRLKLSKAIFFNDALVIKNMLTDSIILKSEKSKHSLKFNFSDFPYFGIWAAKDANFVCLEPWCGIADNENSNQQLNEKEGINTLAPTQIFERAWSVELS